MPIHIASKHLSVSCSVLRNSLKRHGIRKWPYRYLQRLDRQIKFLRNMEIELQKPSELLNDNLKATSSTRRMIEALVKRKEELENHPELLGEQEEVETTPQEIQFLICNSQEASMEDVSTSICTEVCCPYNSDPYNLPKDRANLTWEEAQVADETCFDRRIGSVNQSEKVNIEHSQRTEDPCRTFVELLIELGEAGIQNLKPATILDLATTYYAKSLLLERKSSQT